jgi:hypothetical protein
LLELSNLIDTCTGGGLYQIFKTEANKVLRSTFERVSFFGWCLRSTFEKAGVVGVIQAVFSCLGWFSWSGTKKSFFLLAKTLPLLLVYSTQAAWQDRKSLSLTLSPRGYLWKTVRARTTGVYVHFKR